MASVPKALPLPGAMVRLPGGSATGAAIGVEMAFMGLPFGLKAFLRERRCHATARVAIWRWSRPDVTQNKAALLIVQRLLAACNARWLAAADVAKAGVAGDGKLTGWQSSHRHASVASLLCWAGESGCELRQGSPYVSRSFLVQPAVQDRLPAQRRTSRLINR